MTMTTIDLNQVKMTGLEAGYKLKYITKEMVEDLEISDVENVDDLFNIKFNFEKMSEDFIKDADRVLTEDDGYHMLDFLDHAEEDVKSTGRILPICVIIKRMFLCINLLNKLIVHHHLKWQNKQTLVSLETENWRVLLKWLN